jgi:hypothetical protein
MAFLERALVNNPGDTGREGSQGRIVWIFGNPALIDGPTEPT